MSNIYKLGKNLGISQADIDSVLKEISNVKEKQDFIMGSPTYAGGYYGSISIIDF